MYKYFYKTLLANPVTYIMNRNSLYVTDNVGTWPLIPYFELCTFLLYFVLESFGMCTTRFRDLQWSFLSGEILVEQYFIGN